jgi:hypothetical protein
VVMVVVMQPRMVWVVVVVVWCGHGGWCFCVAFWKADCHDAWGGWQGNQHTAAGLNRSQHNNGALGRSASACPSRSKAEREMQRPAAVEHSRATRRASRASRASGAWPAAASWHAALI